MEITAYFGWRLPMPTKTVLETKRCAGKVYGDYSFFQCSRNAGASGFCGVHDPGKIAARNGKRLEKWRAQDAAAEALRDRRIRIETITEEIIDFVRALSEDPRTLPWFETARELIARLDRDAAIAKQKEAQHGS
jgi:hypothetical protein